MSIRRLSLAAGTALTALALAACGSGSSAGTAASPSTPVTPSTPTSTSTSPTQSTSPTESAKGKIVIGAADFSESKILANLYAAALDKAGFTTEVKVVGAREIYEPALEKGSAGNGVDVVPEYLATITEFLNAKKNGANPKAVASSDVDKTLAGGQPLANGYGITLLTPSTATDENAFAVTTKFATDNNLKTLSDLANYKGDLVLGGPSECPTRPFCELGLVKTYGIKFKGFKAYDAGGPLTKQAILQNKVQVGLVFSSSSYGGTASLGLQVLTDDKGLQNADNIVAAVNTKVVSDALTAALNAVDTTLTPDDLVALNKSVDIDRKDPAAAAKAYATAKGLG